MQFKHNSIHYSYPTTLAEITLSQRIAFHHQYGVKVEEEMAAISKLFDDESIDIAEREIREAEVKMMFACQSFSFFTGIPLPNVLSEFDLHQVVNVYNTSLAMLLFEESNIDLQTEYEFAGETWVIAPPVLNPTSKITFNEFLVSKEVVRQMQSLSKGRWDALPYLAAVYLRKPDEVFDENFVDEDSDRMKLFQNLPMDIAMAVGFFLTSSMHTWQTGLPSFEIPEEKELTSPPTSTVGAGLAS